MSIKKFTSSILMLISVLSFSQGITVQGIARDPNNNARQNQPITILAELNYLNPISGANVVTYNETITIITDEFGVFSTVLKVPNSIQSILTAHEHYLKISEGSMIISNELLRYVPYAYSAYNGVPSGSIMPYIGVSAPKGWMLCDGRSIPTTDETAILRDLLGASVTPNLNGMFLRGTGTSPVNKQDGPALMNTQADQNKSHKHGKGNLKTTADGNHSHTLKIRKHFRSFDGADGSDQPYQDEGSSSDNLRTNNSGNHSHNIIGETSNTGGNESRPVNFGVNYIIKL